MFPFVISLFLNFESSLFFFTPVGLLLVWMMVLMSSKYITSFNNKFQLSEIVGHFSSGKYYPGLLFMMSMFFLILLFNLYGLVPSMFPLSSLPFLTMSMAVILWSGSYVYCLSKNLLSCVSHMLPLSSPMVLSVFLVWVEVLSWLCRPIALGVRLMANITAGHLLLSLVSGGVFFSGVWFLLPFGFLLALMLMEISVAMIQSYVYNLLLSLYMDESL